MGWIKCTEELPDFNMVVLAWLAGGNVHSELIWARRGMAFMVRHDCGEFTVKDKWARDFYDKALASLGADFAEITHWARLPEPPCK